MSKKLLTTLDLEIEYGGKKRTWDKRRLTGDTPRFIKLGRSVYYDRADVEEWLAARKRRSTSDPGPEVAQ